MARGSPRQPAHKNEFCQKYYFLPSAEFPAKMEITLPDVDKLYNGSNRRGQHQARFVGNQRLGC